MPKKETTDRVMPHSDAKLQFYIRYLERYIRVLFLSRYITKVNIYDMFCGAGLYSDGNTGSALRAVDAIWAAMSLNSGDTAVNLHLNDLDSEKVAILGKELATRSSSKNNFQITTSSYEASALLSQLPNGFAKQNKGVRNLVFIDPYGYKAITKLGLEGLLLEAKTELILFLPIEQMYRFKDKALTSADEPSFRPLFDFIDQFNIDVKNISSEKEFIKAVERALCFSDSIYTTSYAIKNHSGHYYGVFFITPNILGLEKILDVKWQLDVDGGEEYSGSSQVDCFLETERKSVLEAGLIEFLSKEVTNADLYEYILTMGFLPKHASDFLVGWERSGKLIVTDMTKQKPARKKSFKIKYEEYKSGMSSRKFILQL